MITVIPGAACDGLVEGLPAVRRLALAYAPAASRAAILALLALDCRLEGIVRRAREPVLAQLRLAWWRETLSKPVGMRPSGEPLIGLLPAWDGQVGALVALVDGWEGLLGEEVPAVGAHAVLADARASAFGALAWLAGEPADAGAAREMARAWALCDLAGAIGDPAVRHALLALVEDRREHRLSRALRPLVVLHGLARRAVRNGRNRPGLVPFDMLYALRLGLLGL